MAISRKYLWALGALILVGAVAAGAYFFSSQQMPDLDRPFTPAERFPEDIRQLAIEKVDAATAQLRENPDLMSAWLELAVYRKGADDYEGAEEIWVYLTKKWPDDPTPYANLADLYLSNLNEPRKAERYWKKYLEVAPSGYDIVGYRALHDLYRTKLSNPDKAREILLEGLEEDPNNTDLLIPLATFERDNGDTAKAREYFEQAKSIADRTGNTALSAIIEGELGQLPE